MKNIITFCFDVISPYSYFAFESILKYNEEWKADLNIVPVTLQQILVDTGNPSPYSIPSKFDYYVEDMERAAKLFNVPFKGMPEELPESTILAQQILTLTKKKHPDLLIKLTRGLFEALWIDGKDLSQTQVLIDELTSLGLTDSATFVDEAGGVQVRDELIAITKRTVARGIFGVPSTFVYRPDGAEGFFFGSDRLEHICYFLGTKYNGPHGPSPLSPINPPKPPPAVLVQKVD